MSAIYYCKVLYKHILMTQWFASGNYRRLSHLFNPVKTNISFTTTAFVAPLQPFPSRFKFLIYFLKFIFARQLWGEIRPNHDMRK